MIYLASPFFNNEEISILSRAEQILRSRGFEVFSPREHELREYAKDTDEWYAGIFEMDRDAIDRSDTLVMIYHGNYSDSGTAWECGYAHARGKKILVVHVQDEIPNLMVHVGATANITLEELETYDFEEMPEKPYHGKSY